HPRSFFAMPYAPWREVVPCAATRRQPKLLILFASLAHRDGCTPFRAPPAQERPYPFYAETLPAWLGVAAIASIPDWHPRAQESLKIPLLRLSRLQQPCQTLRRRIKLDQILLEHQGLQTH